jgi:predicted kinase
MRGISVREPFAKFIRRELKPVTFLITCGLPGTWKTETSEEVSKIKGYAVLRSDLIRLQVLKSDDVFDPKVAGNMSKRLSVYDEMFQRADDYLRDTNKGLILDATFVTQELRRRAADLAAKHNRVLAILETKCSENTSIVRIQRRTKEKYESNALTVEAYRNNKGKFEPVDVDSLKKAYPNLPVIHFTVDTEKDLPQSWYVIDVEKR